MIALPTPVARRPTWLADVAVVVAVVRSVLPLKLIVLPDCASPPVVVVAVLPVARFRVMPFAVMAPVAPDALRPVAPAGVTLMTVRWWNGALGVVDHWRRRTGLR